MEKKLARKTEEGFIEAVRLCPSLKRRLRTHTHIHKPHVTQVHKDRVQKFSFFECGTIPPPVLSFDDVSFGYTEDKLIYKNLDFGVDLDSRCDVDHSRPCLSSSTHNTRILTDVELPLSALMELVSPHS